MPMPAVTTLQSTDFILDAPDPLDIINLFKLKSIIVYVIQS